MEEFLQVGVITATHGIHGEVKVFPTTDDPKRFKKLKKVLLDTGREKLELEVEGVKFFKNMVILKFKEYRVSSDSENQMHSYAAQIRNYTEVIAQHDGWDLVDVYADEGLTGTRVDKRDDFNRMMRDCRKGKIDCILVNPIKRPQQSFSTINRRHC